MAWSPMFPSMFPAAPCGLPRASFVPEFQRLRMAPVVADYTCGMPIHQPKDPAPRLILYIGSSIGNFDPMEAAALLARVRRTMQAADRLLLGVDLAKAPQVLLPAYNDAQGVTAAFNKNVLHRINHELEGDFDLDRFRHVAVWNQQESRVEMHLESAVAQQVWLSGLTRGFGFEAGETIHTENSYKYTPAMLQWLFGAASMTSLQSWTDDRHWFELHMLGPDLLKELISEGVPESSEGTAVCERCK